MQPIVLDIESCPLDEQEILSRLPAWDIEEARTRLPKNYSKPESQNEWLEKDRLTYAAKAIEKAALTPELSEIVCVGLWIDGDVYQHALSDDSPVPVISDGVLPMWHDTEESLLRSVWRELRDPDTAVIGWNLLGFDLKFLIQKSWMLGVPVPKTVFNPAARYPIPERFICLMEKWCVHRGSAFSKMDAAAKALGIQPKDGNGKDFPEMWRKDRLKALQYNVRDVLIPVEIARRIGLLELQSTVHGMNMGSCSMEINSRTGPETFTDDLP